MHSLLKWETWNGKNHILGQTDNKNILGQSADYDKKVDR